MKIDWGRVPKGTKIEVIYNDNRESVRYFVSLDKDYIKASEYSVDGYVYDYECNRCNLLLPSDIEKYSISENKHKYFTPDLSKYVNKVITRYVCPACGEEVAQNVDMIISNSEIYDKTDREWGGIKVTRNEIHICENKNCGILLSNKNGHFGKKVGG